MSKGDGLKIGIRFTEDLVGDVSGNKSAFTITGKEYQYVNGSLIDKAYQIEKVERYPTIKTWQDDFNNGVVDDVKIGTEGIILATGGATGYTDDLTSGIAYISTSDFSTSYAKHMAFDDNTSSSWSATGTVGQAVGVDFGISKKISKLRMMTNGRLKNFDLEGSNDNSTWIVIYTGTQLGDSNWQEYTFENSIGYRYYRVKCTGSLYTGSNVMITEIEMMESLLAYVEEGNYTTIATSLTNGQYRLGWIENKPTNTDITVEYATGEVQGEWQEINNGELIDINTNLWIKVRLSTLDTSVSPILQDLWLEEPNAPQDKILITFDWWGRFNNVEDKIKVLYDASKGSLTGAGGAVESFEIEFTPEDLIQTPNPNEEELIKAYPYEIVLDLNELTFINAYSQETIKAYPYEIVLELKHVSEINP